LIRAIYFVSHPAWTAGLVSRPASYNRIIQQTSGKYIFILTLVITLAGCSMEESLPPESFIRVVHASRNGGSLSLFVDASNMVNGLDFTQKTNFFPVDPGNRTLTALSYTVADSVVFSTSISLQQDNSYTAILVGDSADIEPYILQESTTSPPRQFGRFRFFNASTTAGSLDVYFTTDSQMKVEDMEPQLTGLGYKQVSQEIDTEKGVYDFYFTEQGTKTVVAEGYVTLSDGNIQLLIPVESSDDGTHVVLSL